MNYLNLGFAYLKNSTVKIGGVNYDCIFDTSSILLKRNFGFEEENRVEIMVETSTPATIGQSVTLGSTDWQISTIRAGLNLKTLVLTSKNV